MSHKQMTTPAQGQPAIVEIRVTGHLGPQWVDWFDEFSIVPQPDGDTLLTGPVLDQAALYGLLKKIQIMGMPLRALNHIEQDEASSFAGKRS